MSANLDGYNTPHSGMRSQKVDKRLDALEKRLN